MILNVIPFVHKLLEDSITVDDICVDATCGNGHDTMLLAKFSKHVYAFDVQQQAIDNTKEKLETEHIDNVTLIKDSHANVLNYVTDKIKAATFNLGYLPGSDKSIITKKDSTIEAIKHLVSILDKHGVIAITLYIGHAGGDIEANAVEEYVSSLERNQFRVIKYDFINRVNSPYVIVIEKQ